MDVLLTIDLFREYFTIQQKQIFQMFDSILEFNKAEYESNLDVLINDNFDIDIQLLEKTFFYALRTFDIIKKFVSLWVKIGSSVLY